MTKAGLTIDRLEDWKGKLSFTDVGAIVYYLKAIPWLVPDFSVDRHTDVLIKLQEELEAKGGLEYEAGLFLIEARKS